MPAVLDIATVDIASESLSDALSRAEVGKERVIMTRHGKPVAAVVPLADLEALEAIEDTADAAAAAAALAEWEAAGRPLGATLEELARRHGIDLRIPNE